MDGRSPLRTAPLAGLLDLRVTGRLVECSVSGLPVAPQPDRVFAVTDAPARVPGLTSLPGSQRILGERAPRYRLRGAGRTSDARRAPPEATAANSTMRRRRGPG